MAMGVSTEWGYVESFMEESDIIMEDTPEATLVTSLATQI
jgi:hypothetical protein